MKHAGFVVIDPNDRVIMMGGHGMNLFIASRGARSVYDIFSGIAPKKSRLPISTPLWRKIE
jgi:hypothetical protein